MKEEEEEDEEGENSERETSGPRVRVGQTGYKRTAVSQASSSMG